MNTLTGGKAKKQAGLGNIDSRLAEIRDATTALFYPPDKMVVITFLFLYLEILYGCLYMDNQTLEDRKSDYNQTNTLNSFTSEFDQIKLKIAEQYFYKNYADLLGLSKGNLKDPLITDIESIFSKTLVTDSSVNVGNAQVKIQGLMEDIQVLEQEIGRRFSLGLDQENLSPVGRFIVGTFLLIYLELFSLYVLDEGQKKESSSMRVSKSSLLVTAITQEYFYAQRDKLLTGSLKTEFDEYFQTQIGGAEAIKKTEQKIFLCLKPLMPF
ncbi:hypothetical protein PN437_17530 [Microcystis aeruginosa CS-564/01]|uniref:hypothetical protein n=1 Tax=Microcystis aeruginosa TaxID=1126 RepID=UPI00232E401B|nr:hypothetical protein [Microcystis aeruginosa]MDB9426665.1 hypothetical protein [Microcystis aeruginosa CS-564/01]